MRKLVLAVFAVALVAAVPAQAPIASVNLQQAGNGLNGMTAAAPSLATDGVAVVSSAFTTTTPVSVASSAEVCISGNAGVFVTHATQAYLRGWVYKPTPVDGGALLWQPQPSMDQVVDAGVLGGQGGAQQMCFGPIALPPMAQGERVSFTGEQVHQATTLDAGIGVEITLF